MKLFWKIYLVVFLLFIIVMGAGIYVLSEQRISEVRNSISGEYKTIGSLLAGDVRRGHLESEWPFESLQQLSQRDDFIFWWIVKEDGTIHLANDVKLVGHRIDEYIPNSPALTEEGAVVIHSRENYGLFTEEFHVGKYPWSFWIGFSTQEINKATDQVLMSSIYILSVGLVVLGICLYFCVRYAVRPIRELVLGTEQIQRGNLNIEIAIQSEDELGNLAQCFNRMARHLKRSTVSIDDLSSIFLAAPIGMMLVDDQLNIVKANGICGDMIGRRPEDLEGMPYRVGFGCGQLQNIEDSATKNPDCENCRIREILDNALERNRPAHNIEQEIQFSIGSLSTTHWIEVSVEPVTLHDRNCAVVAVHNISQRKRDEQKMQKLNQELEDAVIKARQAETTKSEFLATMSHEIRTPMNSILGFSELLLTEAMSDQQRQFVNMIHRSTGTLLEIINDILDFSKIEAGKMALEVIDCKVRSIADDIDSLLRPSAKSKNIDLQMEIDPRVPEMIQTDPTRLKQCLINLINNAIKFTQKGFVKVRATSDLGRNGQQWIQFKVQDTGIGIPPEKLESIFDSFSQADQNTTRKFGGTGLGLAITKRLTELLGGKISVTSAPGDGTSFFIDLPVKNQKNCEAIKPENVSSNTSETIPDTFSGKILVAEDHPSNQMLIRILLERAGLDVTIVKDGKAAVEEATTHSYSLILMDIQMPLMNGLEATHEIRRQGKAVPIVALTANTMKGDEEKCLEAGCDSFLGKPIIRDELFKTLHQFLPSQQLLNSSE